MRVDNQSAFVLHSRPYRDNKELIELFTADYGKIGCVASIPRGKRRRISGKPQAFSKLSVSLFGKGELKTARSIEVDGPTYLLQGNNLLSGFYLNELLLRLLPKEDDASILFQVYETTLQLLCDSPNIEPILREFEKKLLSELGYGLTLDCDAATGEALELAADYMFRPEFGLKRIFTYGRPVNSLNHFTGAVLQAIDQNNYENTEVRRSAKKLMRMAIDALLGGKPLQSRELFRPSK